MAEIQDPERDRGQRHRRAEDEQEGEEALPDRLEESDPGDPGDALEGGLHGGSGVAAAGDEFAEEVFQGAPWVRDGGHHGAVGG